MCHHMDLEQGSCNQRKEISFVAVSFFYGSVYNKNNIGKAANPLLLPGSNSAGQSGILLCKTRRMVWNIKSWEI